MKRERECLLAYFIIDKPIYIKFKLKEKEHKVRNKDEDRWMETFRRERTRSFAAHFLAIRLI